MNWLLLLPKRLNEILENTISIQYLLEIPYNKTVTLLLFVFFNKTDPWWWIMSRSSRQNKFQGKFLLPPNFKIIGKKFFNEITIPSWIFFSPRRGCWFFVLFFWEAITRNYLITCCKNLMINNIKMNLFVYLFVCTVSSFCLLKF